VISAYLVIKRLPSNIYTYTVVKAVHQPSTGL
jgi:hypothetical protein